MEEWQLLPVAGKAFGYAAGKAFGSAAACQVNRRLTILPRLMVEVRTGNILAKYDAFLVFVCAQ